MTIGNNIVTLYAHGSEILVESNQTVVQGQAVLKVGSTGYSTGPHAHFEVRINGDFANPEDYFEYKSNFHWQYINILIKYVYNNY